MKRLRSKIGVALLAACCAGNLVYAKGKIEERRPNILWIFLEDTSPYFGCYGDGINQGHTPTIDGMAEVLNQVFK